jgi:hypothetical protein
MDRATIEDDLAEAERHVAEGFEIIERQYARIAELQHHGRDTGLASGLLREFELVQAVQLQDRDRLRAALAILG